MAALLVVKLLVPYAVVCTSFALMLPVQDAGGGSPADGLSGMRQPRASPVLHTALLVLSTSTWALALLVNVVTEGSWKEVGNSVSHYLIAGFTAVLAPALLSLGRWLVRCETAAEKRVV